MALVNGVIPKTIFKLDKPLASVLEIESALNKLKVFSNAVENCGYPLACQTCQSQCHCDCNCDCSSGDSDSP